MYLTPNLFLSLDFYIFECNNFVSDGLVARACRRKDFWPCF